MCDRDYVIQIEGQSSNNAKLFDATAGAAFVKILPCSSSSRRTSTSSQHSSLPSCTSPNYDSGNFSCSNTSDTSIQPIEDTSSVEDESSDYLAEFNFSELTDDVKQLQRDIREKDQMLLLAVADARKMKSEMERLVKSERWYKNELSNQKRSRLEILEKLYLNERKFVEENQKLKADCANLYSVCSEVEKKALGEKDSLIKQLQDLQRLFESIRFSEGVAQSQSVFDQINFELQKQREVVLEKESLIEVLKKQKQSLLKDLGNLTVQRDSKIINLEANTFTLEQENRKITQKCVKLVEEKRNWEKNLRRLETLLEGTKSILQQREIDITQLREKHQKQLDELQVRATEFEVLKDVVNDLEVQKLKQGSNNSENLRLVEKYKKDIEKKTDEIEQLKSHRREEIDKISKLQIEIVSLENLRENYECSQREVEQLKLQLQSKESEIENLRKLQIKQTNQITSLQEKLMEYQRLRDNFDKYVNLLQANNETLEARENEIEQLKIRNESLLRDLYGLKETIEKHENVLEMKDTLLCNSQRQIEEFQAKFHEHTQAVEVLSSKIEDSQKIHEILADCQDQLKLANETVALKESEIVNLKKFIKDQTEKFLELNTALEENSKLSKHIDNLNNELVQRSTELSKLRGINSKQTNEILKLNQCTNQLEHLQTVVEDKIIELHNRDIEMETLRLVLKGQKAQIKRFQCKCTENDELREKFEEASNLLKMDKDIFESEAAELDYLRKIADRQAMKIYKLTEEREDVRYATSSSSSKSLILNDNVLREKLLELEKYFGNVNLHETHDLEAKAYKIEMMKALLNNKSDKILQLNGETNRWIELLNNIEISRSRSRDLLVEKSPEFQPLDIEQEKNRQKENQVNTADNSSIISKGTKDTLDDIIPSILDYKLTNENLSLELKEKNMSQVSKTKSLTELNHTECDENVREMEKNMVLLKTDSSRSSDDKRFSISTQSEAAFVIIKPDNKKSEPFPLKILSFQNLLENYENEIVIHPPNDLTEFTTNFDEIKSGKNMRKTSLKVPENCVVKLNYNDPNWKLFKRVLESEHRKKISRYQIHMRTLLENIKSYKKKLQIMEKRQESLVEKYQQLQQRLKEAESENESLRSSYMIEMDKIMTAKVKEIQEQHNKNLLSDTNNAKQLQEINKKYEKSQRIIAALKHQLEKARNQFLEMDDYKRLSVEFKLNLDSFVDDYTKLLSPLDSYKNSISSDEIYALINRSNNLVPNFDNLTNSVDALKTDIKKLSSCVAIGRISPDRKMSLLDELKAADPSRFS